MKVDEPGNNNNRRPDEEGQRRDTLVQRAGSEMVKLRDRILGKKIMKNVGTGEIRVVEPDHMNSGQGSEAEEEIPYEEVIDEDEESIDITVQVEEVRKDKEVGVGGSTSSLGGYSYLEELETAEKEQERNDKTVIKERKRKKEEEEDIEIKLRGLKVMPEWCERSRMARNSEKWQRTVVDKTVGKEEKVQEMKVPVKIPDSYDLSLDKRGNILNSSNRRAHNFGVNRGPVFGREDGKKGDGRNWTASFTRAGCVACRNEGGMLNHRGRS
jgi:hypothetical protein